MRHMTGKGECLSSSDIFVELTSMQVPADKAAFICMGLENVWSFRFVVGMGHLFSN